VPVATQPSGQPGVVVLAGQVFKRAVQRIPQVAAQLAGVCWSLRAHLSD
jgi:hypothetical protein